MYKYFFPKESQFPCTYETKSISCITKILNKISEQNRRTTNG